MAVERKVRVFRPESFEGVLQLKARLGYRARVVAGGTDLLLQMRAGKHRPAVLIELPRGEQAPAFEEGYVRLPATTPLAKLTDVPALAERLPLLVEAMRQIGSPQIRNVATLGGNLGNASPAADSAPPLLVYEASLSLASLRGRRIVPVGSLFAGPGKTALAKDEVIEEVIVPLPVPGEVGVFRKFGARRANVISAASFAARIVLGEGRVRLARFAAGSVAPTPIRLGRAEAAVTGHTPAELAGGEHRRVLTEALAGDLAPISDVRGSAWYKGTTVRHCVESLLDRLANAERGL
jgi:carbon-monoxide dehydrogenase medium subunit